MCDTTFILVTGKRDTTYKFKNCLNFNTNLGECCIEFLDYTNKDIDDNCCYDYTIVINSKNLSESLVKHVDYNNYMRKSLIQEIMTELVNEPVKILDKKIIPTIGRSFVYLDPTETFTSGITDTRQIHGIRTFVMLLLYILYNIIVQISCSNQSYIEQICLCDS